MTVGILLVMHMIIKFLISFGVFLTIDLVWLGVIARRVYVHYMGHLLRTPPNWPVAGLFYGLFVVGLMIFAILPGLEQKSVAHAMKMGALFGFFTYMTYDLTNWAVLNNWPAGIVWIDILWGTVLSTLVAGISTRLIMSILK